MHSNLIRFLIKHVTDASLPSKGQVESIARKSPKELTSLFEQISGSDQFKEDYERLLHERDVAKEDANFMEKKRKGLKVEQKEYKEQKREADNHSKLKKELNRLKTRSLLFQLYHLAKDVEDLQKDIDGKRLELANADVRLTEGTNNANKIGADLARSMKDLDELERTFKDQQKSADAMRTDAVVTSNESTHLRRKIEKLEAEVAEAERRKQITVAKREQLEGDLERLNQAEADFERKNADDEAAEKLNLSDSDLREFLVLKETAREQTAKDRSSLLTLTRDQGADTSVFEDLHVPLVNDLSEKVRILEQEEGPAIQKRVDLLDEQAEKIRTELQLQRKERDTIQEKNNEVVTQKTAREAELAEVQEELKKARVDNNESERQIKMTECVNTMRRLFSGVHGRIIDLIEPTQDRYRVAIPIALGAHMDAIVVADHATAINCIQYMKEQRIGVATFIPMDSIRSNVSYDRLRTLEPGVIKPIIDVIKFDTVFQPAMEYVCGSTLICATLEKARWWAFDNGTGKRYKVVTFDGMLIAKSGFMTGGTLGKAGQRGGGRWEEKLVADLKAKRDTLIAQIQDLNGQMRSVTRERELQATCATLEARLDNINRELGTAQLKRDQVLKQTRDAKAKLEDKKVAKKQAEQAIREREPQIEELSLTISTAEDSVFHDFSEKVGISNIVQWEERRKTRLRTYAERQLVFKTQRARIENLLAYAKQQEAQASDPSKLQETLEETIQKKAKTDNQVARQKETLTRKDAELKEAQTGFDDCREACDELEKQHKAAVRHTEALKNVKEALTKYIHSKGASLSQFKEKRHQVLESAVADDIRLPRVGDEDDSDSESDAGGKPRGGDGDDEDESDASSRMDVDEPAPQLRATQSMSTLEIEERIRQEDEIVIDFKDLSSEYKNAKTQAQREEKLANLSAEIQNIGTKIEAIAPNYKAEDRLGVVGGSIEKLESEIEAAHTRAQNCRTEYVEIREKRHKAFLTTFEKINARINEVYKRLTGGFGQAVLESSVDAPYANPITYSLAPKSKAFTDIQHLSGGEQSVAALALLFAIQSVRPSPFFVLDEVDAALDSDNVGVVAEYFKNRSDSLQFIVISLKDKCFEKADALVGVYQDRPNSTSRSITLDLNEVCGGPYVATI